MAALARRSDVVLMDLRAFGPDRAGCRYELELLLDLVAVERIVLAIDATTDVPYLHRLLGDSWAKVAGSSPNAATPDGRLQMVRLDGLPARVGALLATLERAGRPAVTVARAPALAA